jgi:N-acetylglutamate synthase-like GNAT family acetyltransferase
LARALVAAGATVRFEQRPGDIGAIIRLHGLLYTSEHGYSLDFEGYVAKTFAGYAWPLSARERLWLVEKSGELRGCIAIVKASDTIAQLRWLLLLADLRGRGLGRALVSDALAFCREKGFSSVTLWTEGSLSAATSLYKSFGFVCTEAKTSEIWGTVRTEERYDLQMS